MNDALNSPNIYLLGVRLGKYEFLNLHSNVKVYNFKGIIYNEWVHSEHAN